MPKPSHSIVEFSKPMALPGAIAGAAIAVGVPAVTMIYGSHLSSACQMVVILSGLLLGAGIAFVAAFFAAVMPSSVRGGPESAAAESKPELVAIDEQAK